MENSVAGEVTPWRCMCGLCTCVGMVRRNYTYLEVKGEYLVVSFGYSLFPSGTEPGARLVNS